VKHRCLASFRERPAGGGENSYIGLPIIRDPNPEKHDLSCALGIFANFNLGEDSVAAV